MKFCSTRRRRSNSPDRCGALIHILPSRSGETEGHTSPLCIGHRPISTHGGHMISEDRTPVPRNGEYETLDGPRIAESLHGRGLGGGYRGGPRTPRPVFSVMTQSLLYRLCGCIITIGARCMSPPVDLGRLGSEKRGYNRVNGTM